MRFLVDQPISPIVAEWLRDKGHDAVHVRDRGMSRSSDADIVATAADEDRTVITSDLDFSRIIALARRDRPPIILFRGGNISDSDMLDMLERVLLEVDSDRLSRSVVVVEPARIRVTALPLRISGQ